MKKLFSIMLMAIFLSVTVQAAKITIVTGATGNDVQVMNELLKEWGEKNGHEAEVVPMPSSTSDQFGQYRLWLASRNSDIDLYMVDVIWAPQIAEHLVDLTPYTKDVVGKHFESIIESQTVNGKLVALPAFTDAPALYYRKDLLQKYGKQPPKTWDEMADTAKYIMDKERAAGNTSLYGFVFQGAAYEGLTCDALEWIKSHGGGQIIEPDGSISVNNEKAAKAITKAASWIGTISPEGSLSYMEEDARGVWQLGNAVFMRNWPYAYSLGNGDDSKVKGLFDVVPLPVGGPGEKSAATLGGWNIAVSKYSKNIDVAVELAKYLASEERQKINAIESSKLPTIKSLYADSDVASAQPIIPKWLGVFQNAVPRPSAPAKKSYNEVSKEFWTAVNKTLAGDGTAARNLRVLERKLIRLKGKGWK